jgi:uncharacterized membrane-anchored protein
MSSQVITGTGYFQEKTKLLAQTIPRGAIAFISHRDLDRTAAESLVQSGVKAVVNLECSMTGRFYHEGVFILLHHQIALFDVTVPFKCPDVGPFFVSIAGQHLYIKKGQSWEETACLLPWDLQRAEEKAAASKEKEPDVFKTFMKNSLIHAAAGLDLFIESISTLQPIDGVSGKQVFVVARGAGYREDAACWKQELRLPGSFVMAVDGASEGLLLEGIIPDVIIGDMDSLPEQAQSLNCIFVSHAYMNGKSPGHERLEKIGIRSEKRMFPGMSEDLAMMLAGVSGASKIYSIGCRSGYLEMMEKDREGMGSTLLTRAFLGHKISDLKLSGDLAVSAKLRQQRRAALMHHDPLNDSSAEQRRQEQ